MGILLLSFRWQYFSNEQRKMHFHRTIYLKYLNHFSESTYWKIHELIYVHIFTRLKIIIMKLSSIDLCINAMIFHRNHTKSFECVHMMIIEQKCRTWIALIASKFDCSFVWLIEITLHLRYFLNITIVS